MQMAQLFDTSRKNIHSPADAKDSRLPLDALIDLHLHLDGAITPEIARELARLQEIPLPQDRRQLEAMLSVPPSCESLNDFLRCFAFPLTLLQTREGIREAVRLVLEIVHKNHVIYAEIRFAPQLHTSRGLTQAEVVQAALEGLRSGPIPGNLILCCMRGSDTHKANLETVETAKQFLTKNGGVTALDLAGAEALFPTEDYRTEFTRAAELGIPFTIHAGEAAGPESIRAAVDMGAIRIGHGVRLQEDPALMDLIRDRGIVLEMCPTSNRQTRAVTDMAHYPLLTYLDYGIRVTLNTDDMAISRITLSHEFRYMESLLGLTATQARILLRNAADAAFAGEACRAALKRQVG